MRPPEFTGGNVGALPDVVPPYCDRCFNEAAGIHRRKRFIRWRLSAGNRCDEALQ